MRSLDSWLVERFPVVTPFDFYRGIFPRGELDVEGAFTKGKYTGVIVAVTGEKKANGKQLVKRYSLTDELSAVETAVASNDFCLCSPLSYAGKQRTAEHARNLYAIAVDLDKIRWLEKDGEEKPIGLMNLWKQIEEAQYIPRPTYIVSSGTGLHLYYVLERPISLYAPDIVRELQEYKRLLTQKIWNGYNVDISDSREVQQEGIYQGFRMPGTITKNGGRAVAYLTGERVTMEYLESFIEYPRKSKGKKERGRVTLEDAALKWPDWYDRRIIRKEQRGIWHLNRSVYDWWLRRIKTGATVGHRYYCVMILAMYAHKCSFYDAEKNPDPVTREELERDCFSLIDHMEELTNAEDNHFGAEDVLDALEAFDERWITYPRRSIEYKSGIAIPQNKRNGRDQITHLKIARATQQITDPGGEWRRENGRKPKKEIVIEWRRKNPTGKKADCVRETGLTKPTVYKWWDAKPEKLNFLDIIFE